MLELRFDKDIDWPGDWNVFLGENDDELFLGTIAMIDGTPNYNSDGEDVPVLVLKQIVEFMEKLNDKSSKQSQTSTVS